MQTLSLVALTGLEYMTSQNFPWKKGASHQIRLYLPPENGFNLRKMSFYVQNHSPPKVDPHVNFSDFQVEENLFLL